MNLPPIVNRWQVRQHIDHARTMALDLARIESKGPGPERIWQHRLYADRSAHNAIVAFRRREPITTTTNQGTA